MPTVLTFSLRSDAVDSIEKVAAQVESALQVKLGNGGELLGMQLDLLPWKGIGGVKTYQLHGTPDRKLLCLSDCEEIRIDRAIIDLLKQGGAGDWREPSEEELKAEGMYCEEDIF